MSFAPLRKMFPRIEGPFGPPIERALVAFQEAVDVALRSVQRPIVDGVLLQDVALTTTSTTVNHGLGRPWNGYVVTRSNGNVVVYDGTGVVDSAESISLLASASCVVDLWVF